MNAEPKLVTLMLHINFTEIRNIILLHKQFVCIVSWKYLLVNYCLNMKRTMLKRFLFLSYTIWINTFFHTRIYWTKY